MDVDPIGDGFALTTTTANGILWYGINDLHADQDNQNLIDSKGAYNEGIKFTLSGETQSATVSFKNANDNLAGQDNIGIALYLNGDLVHNVDTTSVSNGSFEISGYGTFDEIRITAEDMESGNTQFRVSGIIADDVGLDTVLPFTIDESMLLANDSDVDNHSDLSLVINNTHLYANDGSTQIGTVGLDGDGNVVVTPDSIEEFNADAPAYAQFSYSVVDENGAQSATTTVTIDVAHGSVAEDDQVVSYTQDSTDEFIIGTDTVTDPDSFEQNLLIVDASNTLDLSHISEINTIELGADATVTGSGTPSSTPPELAAITAEDVIRATDDDNTLIINSSGTDTNASDQVSVDSSLTDTGTTTMGGIEYASYSGDDGATLFIQIDDIVTT